MTQPLNLDWSTAEVSEGTLTIALDEKPPKEWRAVFIRTAALLGAGSWDVSLHAKRGSVEIATVRPGDEERVRQFLEGVMLEANARVADEPEPADEGDGPETDESMSERSPDEALTASFREFADEDGDRGDADPE
jgi:hypothetical protein